MRALRLTLEELFEDLLGTSHWEEEKESLTVEIGVLGEQEEMRYTALKTMLCLEWQQITQRRGEVALRVPRGTKRKKADT